MPPTGKRVEADYVHVMQFDGDRGAAEGRPMMDLSQVAFAKVCHLCRVRAVLATVLKSLFDRQRMEQFSAF